MSERERIAGELSMLGISASRHPLSFARARLEKHGVLLRRELDALPEGRRVRVAGVVISRQRPPTKSGVTVIFMTLEDESGLLDVTVFDRIYQRWGKAIFSYQVLLVEGRLQKKGRYGTVVIADRVSGLTL